MKTTKHTQGFTLLELMITITLIGIMATIALPAMKDFVTRQRLAGDVSRITSVFGFARTEAVRRNQPVLICGGITIKSDGTPDHKCNKIQGANKALLAFIDGNKDNTYNNNTDEDLRSALIGNDRVRIIALKLDFTPDNAGGLEAARFSFHPDGSFRVGLMRDGAASPQYQTLQNYVRITATNGKQVHMALIAPSGRIIPCGHLTSAQFSALTPAEYKGTYCKFD